MFNVFKDWFIYPSFGFDTNERLKLSCFERRHSKQLHLALNSPCLNGALN